MMEKTTNYDEVCQAALFLSHDDLERLIERLIAERDGTFSGFLPQDGFKRPLGRELCSFGWPACVREKVVNGQMNPPNQSRAVVMIGRSIYHSR